MSNGQLSVWVKRHFKKCQLSKHIGRGGCRIWGGERIVGEGDGV